MNHDWEYTSPYLERVDSSGKKPFRTTVNQFEFKSDLFFAMRIYLGRNVYSDTIN